MSNRSLGFLAAFGATLIYGLNHTVAKNVMPIYIGPYAFILLRVVGASLLFWTVSLSIPCTSIHSGSEEKVRAVIRLHILCATSRRTWSRSTFPRIWVMEVVISLESMTDNCV